ncbi:MAG: phage head closure protein [Planctomycetota bacterium]
MRAGDLRHRVTFEQRDATTDDAGQAVNVWKPFAENVPAAVEFGSGSHGRRGEQVEENATHTVECRWLEGVTSAMRIRHGDRIYDIVSCGDPEGRRIRLVCNVNEAA